MASQFKETNMREQVIENLIAKAPSKEAIKAIELADIISDMILFHTRVRINGDKMMQPWED